MSIENTNGQKIPAIRPGKGGFSNLKLRNYRALPYYTALNPHLIVFLFPPISAQKPRIVFPSSPRWVAAFCEAKRWAIKMIYQQPTTAGWHGQTLFVPVITPAGWHGQTCLAVLLREDLVILPLLPGLLLIRKNPKQFVIRN